MAAPELHETVAVGRGTSEGSAVGQGRSTDAGGFGEAGVDGEGAPKAVGGKPYRVKPLLDYADTPPDAAKSLLGDRFLCREGIMLMIGQSGIGKSSAGVQQDISWSVGREAFGIMPAMTLKIVTIQAEDDAGDLSEIVSGVLGHLPELTPQEREMARANCLYVQHKSLTGEKFLNEVVRPILEQERPDLLRINPLQAFLGDDAKEMRAVSKFVRNGLNPLLEEFQCGCIIVHHTPKTNLRNTKDWKALDWMYAGAGTADLTNAARAVLVFDATNTPGIFRLIAAKRGSRIGWTDVLGGKQEVRHFAWMNEGGIAWRGATWEEIRDCDKKPSHEKAGAEELLGLVPEAGTIAKAALEEAADKELGMKRDRFRFLVKRLIGEEKLYEHKFKRSGKRDAIHVGRQKPQSVMSNPS
jgi:hypothetical protein